MEYRNIYNTPREMVNDELLEKLLSENEPGNGNNVGMGCRGNNCRMRQMQQSVRRSSPMGDMTGKPNCRGEYPMSQVAPVASMKPCWSNPCLEGNPLAMVYSPCQEFDGLYEVEEAICHGTLFKALDLVFYPACCSR